MTNEERPEDLAQLLAHLKSEYDVNESEIARAIGVAPATVNAWTNRKRGTSRGPNPDKLRALAAAFPKFTEQRIFAAAGRKAPGPLSPDAEQRILELYRGLTREQQEITETQMRALNEANRN
ncbi:helix-turn-helix domain-containing protein [Streptomyces halobius]|uniref:Helix-turn-helix transcriptional regulator n=1 Tax=Streptomyces halobius TaxID=2879846 RepID=A0ABY4MD82_9ACTN|nr:helix-turn-helix transcriptional regulator [Streptomyces halobius]UQA95735.1 helix-turn-helix transcriptional regulator [Streptomyces halobius]